MKLLLDTHIWLWSALEPGRLGRHVASELANPANELWLSPISTWEALVLAGKKRITLAPDTVSWARANLRMLPFREAPITHEVALQTAHVELAQADPADLILAATAMVYGLTLVTADRSLLHCRGLQTLPNR